MTLETIISILAVSGIGGVIGSIVTHKLKEHSEKKLHLRESKERQYKDLLTNLLGFFEGWENYEIADSKKRKNQFLWEVYTSVPLYASDEVIKLCYKFIEAHNKANKKRDNSDNIYSKIVIAIRKELNSIYGQPDSKLSEKDIKVRKVD